MGSFYLIIYRESIVLITSGEGRGLSGKEYIAGAALAANNAKDANIF